MKKDALWKHIILGILAVIMGITIGLLGYRFVINKTTVLSNNNALNINSPNNSSLGTTRTSIEKMVTEGNWNGYKTLLLDGTIESVFSSSENSSILQVKINIDKILPMAPDKTITKSFLISSSTEVIIHNLSTNKETVGNFAILQKGDTIALWIVKPNDDILKSDRFTTIKIIKFE